jgi:predicted TIM-barrel fold metal-dependent hydrolase
MSAIAVVDTDAHVTEDPELWTSRVSRKWGDLVPHLELVEVGKTREESGSMVYGDDLPPMQAWVTGATRLAMAGQSAYAGWHEPFPRHPPTIDDAHPASHDVCARLKLMDEQGIYIQGLYPNVGGFGSARFRVMKEQELALDCVRAYNDFLVDWTEPAHERFILNAAIPYWDIDAAVAEVERVAPLDFKGIIFSGAPQDHDLPYLADPHWDPLWTVAQAAGMAITFHLGSGNFHGRHNQNERARLSSDIETFTRIVTMGLLDGANHVIDLLHSGVLARYPDLNFVAAESGIGWVPFVLESADYHFKEAVSLRTSDDLLPSERFHRQVYVSFWFEETAPARLLDVIGERNVIFETDFPHPSCLYPTSEVRTRIDALNALPIDVRRRVLQENAAELYGLDLSKATEWEAARAGKAPD